MVVLFNTKILGLNTGIFGLFSGNPGQCVLFFFFFVIAKN